MFISEEIVTLVVFVQDDDDSYFMDCKNKGTIWHLFTHGEYFQPQRALIKHWIQTGYLQKKKTTEDNQLSLSRPKLDPVTPSSIWHQAPPCWINGATSSGWSRRWWATTRLAAVDVVPPAGRSSSLPPIPPRAPPSQVDLYDPSHLKDGGSSIAQHCSTMLP